LENNVYNFEGLKAKFESLEVLIKEKQQENNENGNNEKILLGIEGLKTILAENTQKMLESEQNSLPNQNDHNEYKAKYGKILFFFREINVLEQMVINLEKCGKIKQELESDLSKMSEKISILKAENYNLTNGLSLLKAPY